MTGGRNLTRIGCALLTLAALCGCAQAAKSRRAQLDQIARNCGLPSSVFKLEGGQLHIQPQPNASYRKVDCLLVTARKAGFDTPIAFVGNETFDPKAR